MREIFIKSFDSLELCLAIYEAKKPKAVVQIIHGMCEHKERYDELAKYLQRKNYTVVISDNRGHGKSVLSENDFGYFGKNNGTKALVEDQKKVNDYIKKNYNNLYIYIFSHSMGTLISRNYLKRYDNTIDKIIFSGAPCYASAAGIGIFLAKCLKRIKGEKATSKLLIYLASTAMEDKGKDAVKGAWLSYNKENILEHQKDPLCRFAFTTSGYQTLFEMTKGLHSYKEYKVKNSNLKLLFMSGIDDNVTGGEKGLKDSIETLKRVGYNNIESIVYDKMRHEIIKEDEKELVFKDIVKFYNNK